MDGDGSKRPSQECEVMPFELNAHSTTRFLVVPGSLSRIGSTSVTATANVLRHSLME